MYVQTCQISNESTKGVMCDDIYPVRWVFSASHSFELCMDQAYNGLDIFIPLHEENLCKIKGAGARSLFTTAHMLQHASLHHGAHPSVSSYLMYTLLCILMPYKALSKWIRNQKQSWLKEVQILWAGEDCWEPINNKEIHSIPNIYRKHTKRSFNHQKK